jgi:hypothetical protein
VRQLFQERRLRFNLIGSDSNRLLE